MRRVAANADRGVELHARRQRAPLPCRRQGLFEGVAVTKGTVARTDVGRVREGNEDRYVVREERGTLLLAVADGVGGAPGGEVAADAAVHELAERFFAAGDARSVEDRLADSMRDANTAVLATTESSGVPGAATTLVAAVVHGTRVVIANLGDSRAYLVRAGQIRQLTDDHHGSFPGGITRFVGDPRGVQPDVFVEDLKPADYLLLCSDGLTRHVSDEELAKVAIGAMRTASSSPRPAGSLDGAVETLVELANSRGGEDNITVLLHEMRSGFLTSPRRALAIGIFIALVVLVVGGALVLLYSLAPSAPLVPAPTP